MIANSTNIMPPSFSTASLYVGDLSEDVTEAVLYEIFNTVGHVLSIRVCRDSVTRKSLGYAYVNYHNLADAERALDTLNYTNIKGQPARLMWSHRDPSLRKSGTGNIFVKNLDKTIDNKALFDTFSMFGNILSCKVATDEFGKSKNYGFVHYEDEESAKEAIEKVNGMQLGSKNVYVGHFIKKSERATNDTKFTNLYVKNFPDTVTEEHLKQLFSPYGEITSMIVKSDNKNRKFCFINYSDADSARNAMENLNGKKITEDGKIDHNYDPTKEEAEKAANENSNNTTSDENATTSEATAEKKTDSESATNKDAATKEDQTSANGTTTTVTSTTDADAKTDKATNDSTAEKKDSKKSGESTETPNILYVGPHQSRARRHALLKAKFDTLNTESRNKHPGVNLYIKNLDDSMNDQTLKELFEPYGTITSAKVMKDDKDQSKGFGFVCFGTHEEANKAVTEMHLKIINGKPLYVGLAEKREQRLTRLQQRFRMHPIRHHINNSLNSPMQYPNSQTPQLQFNQNALSYGRPVITTFNQNNLISWRHQQAAAQQQAVHQQAAAQQQLGFNAGLRGQINQMRLYTQNNMMNHNMGQNKANQQLHHNQQYPMGPNPQHQQGNLNAPGQANPQQLQGAAPVPANQLLNNNMRNMNGRGNRNLPGMNMQSPKQMPLNMVGGKQNNPQQNQAQGPPQGQPQGQTPPSQQKAGQPMQQQPIPQNNNFKFTSQARNRMELPNKNANKVNNMNNMTPGYNNNTTLTAAALASAPPSMQKQVLGENLFPLVANYHPTLAGKITGMMLEMDNSELLILLENEDQLKKKIDEALAVLQNAK